jgi:hypothetical protein
MKKSWRGDPDILAVYGARILQAIFRKPSLGRWHPLGLAKAATASRVSGIAGANAALCDGQDDPEGQAEIHARRRRRQASDLHFGK